MAWRMMTKRRLLWGITVLAVLLLALGIASLWVPLTYDLCSKGELGSNEQCATYHVGSFVLFYVFQVFDAHNGAVTAIATCFIAAFTITLWRSTKRLAIDGLQ